MSISNESSSDSSSGSDSDSSSSDNEEVEEEKGDQKKPDDGKTGQVIKTQCKYSLPFMSVYRDPIILY
jgi:hypothetical protein